MNFAWCDAVFRGHRFVWAYRVRFFPEFRNKPYSDSVDDGTDLHDEDLAISGTGNVGSKVVKQLLKRNAPVRMLVQKRRCCLETGKR